MHIIFDICVTFFHKSNNLYLGARESVYGHFDPCCGDPEERFHAARRPHWRFGGGNFAFLTLHLVFTCLKHLMLRLHAWCGRACALAEGPIVCSFSSR